MSILIGKTTRVLVFGLTGRTARVDAERALHYGTRIVAGVSPGRGGERVHGVPVYDTASLALQDVAADAAVFYVPPQTARDAVFEALAAGLKLLLVTTEFVPRHDVVAMIEASREAKARLIGCNTNGIIAPGKCRLGGIGGVDPSEIYVPGTIGVCSRSGGMTAEIGLALKHGGFGISTAVSMGGDERTGLTMLDYAMLFEDDPDTEAIIVFGEPGTENEHEIASAIASGRIRKPVIAMIVGQFQEAYPPGITFGHAAAMIASDRDTATAKRLALGKAGAYVVARVDDIPAMLRQVLPRREGR